MFDTVPTRRSPEGHVASPKSVADVHATSRCAGVSASFPVATHFHKRIGEPCGRDSKEHFAPDLRRDSSVDVLPDKRRMGHTEAGPAKPKKRRNWAPIAVVPMRNIRLPTNVDPGLLLELKVQYQDMAAMEQQIFGVSTLLSLVKWVLKGHADLKKVAALGRRLSKTRKRFLNVQRGMFDVHNERNCGVPLNAAVGLVCDDSNISHERFVQTATFYLSNRVKSISHGVQSDEVRPLVSGKESTEQLSPSPHVSSSRINQSPSIHQYGSALVSPPRTHYGMADDSYCSSRCSSLYPFVHGGLSSLAVGIHSEMTNRFDPNDLLSDTKNVIGDEDNAKNDPLSHPVDDLCQNLREAITRTGDCDHDQLQTPVTSNIPSCFQFSAHPYSLIPDRSHSEHTVPSNSLEMVGARNAIDSIDFLPENACNRESGESHSLVNATKMFAKELGISSCAGSVIQNSCNFIPSTLPDLSATEEIGHQTAFPEPMLHSVGTNIPAVAVAVLEKTYCASQINVRTARGQSFETTPVEFFAKHYGGAALCPELNMDGESVHR